MHYVTTVAPPPLLTLAEVKRQLDIETDDSSRDDMLAALAGVAQRHLEGRTGILGRWLLPRTVRAETQPHAFRGSPLWLPLGLPPVRSIESVTVLSAGVAVEVASSAWRLGRDPRGANLPRLVVTDQGAWPAIDDREDAVQILMQVGEAAIEDVPLPLRHAALMHVATLFERPELAVKDSLTEFPGGYMALVAPFRLLPM